MKMPRQPQSATAPWPPETVLAMNVCLLTQPMLDLQRWFEAQVVLHLGCSPHGAHMDGALIA